MKTGMNREIDPLGRIVIPAEMRRALSLKAGDLIEFSIKKNKIVVSKVNDSCAICGEDKQLHKLNDNMLCQNCLDKIKMSLNVT